jgi:hypothetical protein
VSVFFKIACGGAAAMSLVITFAIGRSPEPPPAPVVNAAPTVEAQEVEEETDQMRENREIALATLKKANSLAITDPKPVKVEKLVPVSEKKVEVSVKEQKKAESNICTRNGKHKVWVSKYSWRCRK